MPAKSLLKMHVFLLVILLCLSAARGQQNEDKTADSQAGDTHAQKDAPEKPWQRGCRLERDMDAPGRPVVEASIYAMDNVDEKLKSLREFPRIRKVSFMFTFDLTPKGIKSLADLPELRELFFTESLPSTKCLKALKEIKQLETISFFSAEDWEMMI